MSRRVLLVLALTLGVAGCADNILKERPVRRTAVKATAVQPSLSVMTTHESTVCAAYRRQLATARDALVTGTGDREATRRRELTLEAVIADACE
jgi:hypothetical protein